MSDFNVIADASGEYVIRVNEQDEALGSAGKMQVHLSGILHRAFSVFLFNNANQTLLQQRALVKYHSAGLWSNSCCGHPRPDETNLHAAQRRVKEELGIEQELTEVFTFRYRHAVSNDLIENEFVHMFFGRLTTALHPDPAEVSAVKWIGLDELRADIQNNQNQYTPWFQLYLNSCYHDIAQSLQMLTRD
jgi:isopentenyl-diphosphate delta-isomerase